MLMLFLMRAGADVVCAENGQQALEIVERTLRSDTKIDLVVTDLMMPGMNGTDLAEAVRDRGWTIPLIACSAAVMPEEQAACLSAGCNAFVPKPIRRVDFLETCAEWLR